jgi:hypothetical protein
MCFPTWFYNHPDIAHIVGIDMDNVFTYRGNRKNARIYSDGIFVAILRLITGMDLRVSDETRVKMIRLQRDHSKQLDMRPYFEEINGKEMTVLQFEHFLSKVLLVETNRLYNVFSEDLEKQLTAHSIVVFEVLNGLSGGMIEGFKLMFLHARTLYKISKILKTAPEAERLMIFGPQLSLVTNFSKMIMRCKEDGEKSFDELEPNDFLNLRTKFFVFEEHNAPVHRLVFLDRSKDSSDGAGNKAFGPTYIACPGAKMTIDYIQSVLSFLKSFQIDVIGDAKYEGVRFKNISNKPEIFIKFTLKNK